MKSPQLPFRPYSRKTLLILSVLLLCFASGAGAQQPAGAGSGQLPNSPQAKPQSVAGASMAASGKFVGYMTKRSLFFPDIAASPEPLSTGEKFKLFMDQSIAPSVFLKSGFSAGIGQARNVPPEYGQGGEGFGKRYGASMARNASNNIFGTFVLASALHHDPRFFPRSNPTFWGTIKYAARSLVVTRTDGGGETFNTSGLLGPAAGEALAVVYLPASQQTAGQSAERYGSDLAWRFAGNVFKEYWPTLFKNMGLNHLGMIPTPTSVPTTETKKDSH